MAAIALSGRRKTELVEYLAKSPATRTVADLAHAFPAVAPSSIYAALAALERDGYVAATTVGSGRTRARSFGLTSAGRRAAGTPGVHVHRDSASELPVLRHDEPRRAVGEPYPILP